MTPVKQEFRHNPPETYGDCHRACLASLLDLPIEAVPHVCDTLAKEWKERERKFLASLGLIPIAVPLYGELKNVLKVSGILNPDVEYFILGGTSKNECGHSVIANKFGIAHDPSLDNAGIIGPMEDEFYWLTYLVRKV